MSSMVSVSFQLAFNEKVEQIRCLDRKGLFLSFGDFDFGDIGVMLAGNKITELKIECDDGFCVMATRFKDHYNVVVTKEIK